ncbi:serine/threonine protein kinase [Nocardiopsis flavescens]|uniref:Serine/threonine protein kinase n=2 Tax=Nocardiopsis flavescens TaxID=758803 RepID=A0A1M6SUT0_9ACTN|nr:PASTA domain-containing protein [Nocardiopsis flavescens]SHK48491.1 serine/threonine protein kinase [Nocardiopsis flavescens]
METPAPLTSPASVLTERHRIGDGVSLGDGVLLYRASDPASRAEVLIEVEAVPRHLEGARTERADLIADIDHPALVERLGLTVEDGRAFTVTGPVDADPLAHILGERFRERVSKREALDIADTLLSALEEYHERGLVHGAVGPDTVLLADDGSVLLVPVTAEPGPGADPRDDVRAVGSLLHRMITGMANGSDGGDPADLDGEFALLVAQGTAADPAHRPRNASHYRVLVTRARDRLPAPAPRHAASEPAASRAGAPERREEPDGPGRGGVRRPLLWGALCAALLLAALAAWALLAGGGEEAGGSAGATMPDLVGLTPEEATGRLDALEVSLEISYDQVRDDDVEPGLVAATDPAPGSGLGGGDAVTLSVSTGPSDLVVPDLVGEPEAQARRTLLDLGFTEVATVQEPSEEHSSGTVLSTDPGAGESVPHDTPLTLTVSEGVALPDLVGMAEEEALAALADLGLLAETAREDSRRPAGEVLAQDPAAGAVVEPASTVLVTVSSGQDEEPEAQAPPEEGPRSDGGRGEDPREERPPGPGDDASAPGTGEPEPCAGGAWSEGTAYPEGSRVVHNGREYEAVWWNSDISPEETAEWGPWRDVGGC